jgi:hypothetical protein
MGSAIGFIVGCCSVFLLLAIAQSKGYIRRIKKFGNPQIGGRSSPIDPTGITTKGNRDIRCGTFQRRNFDQYKTQPQNKTETPKKISGQDE